MAENVGGTRRALVDRRAHVALAKSIAVADVHGRSDAYDPERM
jgi:hypothetical protein